MRQMDDNLIVRIATIQTIVMSVLLTAGHWLQLHGQHFGDQVSSLFLLHRAVFYSIISSGIWLRHVNQSIM